MTDDDDWRTIYTYISSSTGTKYTLRDKSRPKYNRGSIGDGKLEIFFYSNFKYWLSINTGICLHIRNKICIACVCIAACTFVHTHVRVRECVLVLFSSYRFNDVYPIIVCAVRNHNTTASETVNISTHY